MFYFSPVRGTIGEVGHVCRAGMYVCKRMYLYVYVCMYVGRVCRVCMSGTRGFI